MVRPSLKGAVLSAAITIKPVETAQQWHDFLHMPFKLYAKDPNWVAPLLLERKFHFQPKHNPWFQHGKAAFFLAYRGAEPVGRITAQTDRLHLERYNDSTGFFGFIEAVDAQTVFDALLNAAKEWLSGAGMTQKHKNNNKTKKNQPNQKKKNNNNTPSVMMGHHLPYYECHI